MEHQSRLLRLPRELRDIIVVYIFDSFDLERLDFARHHPVQEHNITTPTRSLPPICVASRQLHDETLPYFLSRITPISHSLDTTIWMRRWLETLSPHLGFNAIYHLSFRNFHGAEQNKGYELIAQLPSLTHLIIMLGDPNSAPSTFPSLAISQLSSSANAYESLDNIIIMHRLHRLFEIPSLKVLEFGFHDWEQMISHDRARQVKEWLNIKFRAQGKDVNIVCKQMQWNGVDGNDHGDEVLQKWYEGNEMKLEQLAFDELDYA